MRNFYIDGTSSATYNIYASGENAYNAAERNVESISVPGRNGNLLIDNGTFKNIDVKYPCVIPFGFNDNASAIRSWLMSNAGGYHKITDDYDATHFRMGRVKGGIEFKPMYTNQAAATFDLTFDCKPQRFLESGETPLVFEEYGLQDIENPTMFEARPMLRVYGSGWIRFTSGSIITISEPGNQYIDIDCAAMQCYEGEENRNANVTVKNGFPVLLPGTTSFSRQGTVTRVDVIPRWWEI